MLTCRKHPFSLYPTCLSSQTESKKKQQDLRKQFNTSQVMYTLYNLYRIILTNTIFEERYFRSINNQLRSKKNSFLSIRRIRLDDAVWYKDLAIIRNKVAFDSFFKSVVREILPFWMKFVPNLCTTRRQCFFSSIEMNRI